MATWTMHLAIAKQLEKKINITNKNEFYFGNIMPDLERWVVPDLNIYVEYKDSHYSVVNNDIKNPIVIDLNKFYKLNEEELKKHNSLIIGYYCHLIVDYYLNDIINSEKVSIFNEDDDFVGIYLNTGKILKCDKNKRKTFKHREYELFNKYLVDNFEIESPVVNEELFKSVKSLNNIKLLKEDIIKIVNKSKDLINPNTFKKFDYDYVMYNEKIMLELFNNSMDYIMKILKEKDLIK